MGFLRFIDFMKEAGVLEERLDEALHVKYVIRKGKRKKKWVSDKDGYKIQYDKNGIPHEKRITGKERRHRALGQRTGKIKRFAIMGKINLRKQISNSLAAKSGMRRKPILKLPKSQNGVMDYMDKNYPVADDRSED